MMRFVFSLMIAVALSPNAAIAQDKPSKAKSWNLTGQVKARFDAKVVDMLCEVSGGAACADKCGVSRDWATP